MSKSLIWPTIWIVLPFILGWMLFGFLWAIIFAAIGAWLHSKQKALTSPDYREKPRPRRRPNLK